MIFINKIKKMKYTIILLFVLLLVTKEDLGDNYTINTFLKYLQENGYYEVINEIKCEISTDVAIEFCEILTESPHCEEVVRVYMTCSVSSPAPGAPSPSYPKISRRSTITTPITPTHFSSPADKLILILEKHQIPQIKFRRLIKRLELEFNEKERIKIDPIIIDNDNKKK